MHNKGMYTIQMREELFEDLKLFIARVVALPPHTLQKKNQFKYIDFKRGVFVSCIYWYYTYIFVVERVFGCRERFKRDKTFEIEIYKIYKKKSLEI